MAIYQHHHRQSSIHTMSIFRSEKHHQFSRSEFDAQKMQLDSIRQNTTIMIRMVHDLCLYSVG